MQQLDVAKAELCALYLGLQSDAVISREQLSPSRSGFEDRSYVRAVFAMFEGVGYATRQYILAQAAAGRYQISTQERDLLSEQTFVLDGKGNIKTKESFLQFLPGFRLTINILGRCLGREVYVANAFGHHTYESFQGGIAIRNRVTHPKLTQEIMLSRDEIETVNKAENWFNSLLAELLGDAFERHSDPVGAGVV
jgi:hypothetical protein